MPKGNGHAAPDSSLDLGLEGRDFISDFLSMTDSVISPEIHRKWSGISCLAGALERRVWARVGSRLTYPNLYVMLVAPPGSGKYIIETVGELWHGVLEPGTKTKALRVAPRSMTKASLVDTLAKCKQLKLLPSGPPLEYHSMLIAAEEMSVLMPAYDLEYIGVLNEIYNNPTVPHTESRRTGAVREIEISFPQLNILAGVQPGWLGSVFPEEAWSTGLTSRMIMVYADAPPLKDIFDAGEDETELQEELLLRLGKVSQLYGEMAWDPDAEAKLRIWHLTGGPPAPTHSKLVYYKNRRTLNVIKLSLVSAVSRENPTIGLLDVTRAISWLCEAENLMPDIFRAMVGKSDHQVIEELHYFLVGLWRTNGGKPIHESHLFGFLRQRVPSEKISKIIEVAERSSVVSRYAGTDTYKPMPRSDFGVE